MGFFLCAVASCCVENCSASLKRSRGEVSFHKFPEDHSMRTLWISATNIEVMYIDNLCKLKFCDSFILFKRKLKIFFIEGSST